MKRGPDHCLPALLLGACLGWGGPAAAQTPSAIVESVKGHVVGADFMDYVVPGQVIKLGAGGGIVLAYLESCMRETITGGVVVVGIDASRTSLASVSREKTVCDTAQPKLAEGAASGGGMAFRNPPRNSTVTPDRIVYSLSPVIEVMEPGKLVIERIDRSAPRYEAVLSTSSLVKARFHDLASAKVQLRRGGVYAATLGSRKVVFKVDQLAEPIGPLLGRLLRL